MSWTARETCITTARVSSCWWLPKATHSVWLASRQISALAPPYATQPPPATCTPSASHDKNLVAWTALAVPSSADYVRHGGVDPSRPHQLHPEAVTAVGVVAKDLPMVGNMPNPALLPPPSLSLPFSPSLAALPRSAVGRMCGMRISVEPSWLTRAPPVSCTEQHANGLSGVAAVLQQEVLHMQFTHADTRKAILEALHWWKGPPPSVFAASTGEAPLPTTSTPTTCPALHAGTSGASGKLSGAIVSSALASSAMLCLLPGPRDGQSWHLPPADAPGACPCCWRVDELQKGAVSASASMLDADSAAKEAKAFNKARKYSGCRIWRRYA